MRTFEIEFFHNHPGVTRDMVAVTVEFTAFKGYPNADSDWDAKDYYDITNVEVTQNGVPVSLDIPEPVIYSELKAFIRDAQITEEFESEGGF